MRTLNEPQYTLGELKKAPEPAAPKPDTFTPVAPNVVRNDRTGALETRDYPPPPRKAPQ